MLATASNFSRFPSTVPTCPACLHPLDPDFGGLPADQPLRCPVCGVPGVLADEIVEDEQPFDITDILKAHGRSPDAARAYTQRTHITERQEAI